MTDDAHEPLQLLSDLIQRAGAALLQLPDGALAEGLSPGSAGHPATATRPPWPQRLPHSAADLVERSLRLHHHLNDPRSFQQLTTLDDTSPEAQALIAAYVRHLHAALAALIDLTAFESPEQPFPELAPEFGFTCSNVEYRQFTVTYSRSGPQVTP